MNNNYNKLRNESKLIEADVAKKVKVSPRNGKINLLSDLIKKTFFALSLFSFLLAFFVADTEGCNYLTALFYCEIGAFIISGFSSLSTVYGSDEYKRERNQLLQSMNNQSFYQTDFATGKTIAELEELNKNIRDLINQEKQSQQHCDDLTSEQYFRR